MLYLTGEHIHAGSSVVHDPSDGKVYRAGERSGNLIGNAAEELRDGLRVVAHGGQVYEHTMNFKPAVVTPLIVDRDPLVPDLVSLLSKACDLPEREEKWGLLKSLTELLVLTSYPPMIMRPENAQTDNHQA